MEYLRSEVERLRNEVERLTAQVSHNSFFLNGLLMLQRQQVIMKTEAIELLPVHYQLTSPYPEYLGIGARALKALSKEELDKRAAK